MFDKDILVRRGIVEKFGAAPKLGKTKTGKIFVRINLCIIWKPSLIRDNRES